MPFVRRATAIPIAICAALSLSRADASAQTNAPPPVIDTAHPKADSTTTVGTLRVERYGHGVPAMIFIPGLSCGSWVWDDAITTYAGTHALYLVTLAGFDGLPAPATAPAALDAADASLLTLVTSERLDRPIVIGHSLGGHLAIRFGEEHAALVRGIVSVDGTPVFPTLANSTPQERVEFADSISQGLTSVTHDQYVSGQSKTIATMVTDPANVAWIAALTALSDQSAVATYANELFRADLRPQLASLTVPTLEIAPVPTVPAAFEDAKTPMADRRELYKGFYNALFPGAPKLTVVTIPNSKHFVMIDQPKALYDTITSFVRGLDP